MKSKWKLVIAELDACIAELRSDLAEVDARTAELEADKSAVWKPLKYVDHSGEPLDGQAMLRDVASELAYGSPWDDVDEWNPRSYL